MNTSGLLAWSGGALVVVAIAYIAAAPALLGKRPNGSIGVPFLLVLLPYFLCVWSIWLFRLAARENAWDEVAPGLFIGRWPGDGRVPGGVTLVVDMTAEFPARSSVMASHDYVCLPTLDLSLPAEGAFESLARRVSRTDGPVFVHCGVGHGRAAIMAAAVLLCRGVARTVPEAISMLKAVRPRVRLRRSQHAFLEGFAARLAAA